MGVGWGAGAPCRRSGREGQRRLGRERQAGGRASRRAAIPGGQSFEQTGRQEEDQPHAGAWAGMRLYCPEDRHAAASNLHSVPQAQPPSTSPPPKPPCPHLEAMAQSPMRREMVSSNRRDCCVQRTSSPPSAVISVLAASMRRCVAAASSSSAWAGRRHGDEIGLGTAGRRSGALGILGDQQARMKCLPLQLPGPALPGPAAPECSPRQAQPRRTPSPTCFCAMAASNCACISSSRPCTTASSSSTTCRSRVATRSSASASRSFWILGSTT